MGKPIPLLLVSDAVSAQTGFGRIARDLASRIHANLSDVYRLATAGHGSPGSSRFPWQQYNLAGMGNDWVIPSLPEICSDFFGDERGIILFIWDCSRMNWFSQPQMFDEVTSAYPGLKEWLINQKHEKWLYCPIDASGPNDRLTFPLMKTLYGFDRILAYTQFGEDVIRRTLGDHEANQRHVTNLPHGINHETFYELPRAMCRKLFFEHTGAQTGQMLIGHKKAPEPIKDDETLMGIVATNQSRKDWALGIATASLMAAKHNIRLWIHIDKLESYWSIPSLLVDYSMLNRAIITTGYVSDEVMAEAYSACDVTLGIGLGEGFGLPLFESMSCGTPVIHGDYGGAPEYLAQRPLGRRVDGSDEPFLVKPLGYRYEGTYACKRPVFCADDWAEQAEQVIGKRVNHCGELDWNNLWPRWERYLRDAVPN